MSTPEENKALTRRLFQEFWNQGKLEVVEEDSDPDIVIHYPEHPLRGIEMAKRAGAAYLKAFPDVRFTLDFLVAEGDKVVARWTAEGTHLGSFMGIPPTGKRFRQAGVTIMRFQDGKAVETWPHGDELGLLRQLGANPTPGRGG
jgi:predicted ester cyclase